MRQSSGKQTPAYPAYCALVLTTTGANRRRDRVAAVSAVVVEPGAARQRFCATVPAAIAKSMELPVDPGTGEAAPEMPWPDVARALRKLTEDRVVVVHDAASALSVADAAGLRFAETPLNLAELASILAPGVPTADLPALHDALGGSDSPDGAERVAADDVADLFEGLLRRIATYDDITLERLALHVGDGGWPFAALFAPKAVARWRQRRGARLAPPEIEFLKERPRPDVLEPTGSLQPIERGAVDAVIGGDGTLSRIVPGFERRHQQEAMAAAVTSALNDSAQLVVEAGTGTGKSLAYLVPAALAATERGDPVVVSTNTLALQDQLLRKDVPDLTEALANSNGDTHICAVSVKGRANYLCLRRWFPWERQPSLEPAEARLKAKVLAWLPMTHTGDRAELHLVGAEEPFWRQISEEEGACDPGSCVFHQRGQCFLFRARRAAEGAHLVIVNHALLLTDATSSNRILPDYDTLVIDEAHHLEDQATAQFTVTLSEREVAELADTIVASDGPALTGVLAGAIAFLLGAAADDTGQRRARLARERLDAALAGTGVLRTAARDLFAALDAIYSEGSEAATGSGRARRVTAATRSSPAWEAVEASWDRLLNGLRDAEGTLRWFLTAVDEVDDVAVADLEEAGERQELLRGDLTSAIRLGADLAARFAGAFDAPEGGRVFWMDRQPGSDRLLFRSAPLDVSGLLHDKLFKKTHAAILTSATMAIDGTCDYLATRLGIPEATSLIVPSPFDYRKSVLLYLADDIPEPTHPLYLDAVASTLVDAIDATQGRALVLFTSHAALSAVASIVTEPLRERGITTLAQRRDGSPQQLVERLRREPNVAVLGTASFWEGVDVAGEALSLLVIARLPFSVPTDPIFAARSEAFEDAFAAYAVPQAVLRFKQGFGRLIRTSQDRGICAVLDRRILTKRYGATFIQSLPECTVEVGGAVDLPGAARSWLVSDRAERTTDARGATCEGESWSSTSGATFHSSSSA